MGDMHYIDEGQGKPVVMVHGNPDWSFSYRHLVKKLSSNYRCVAADHIGFGLSDKPINWSYLPKDHAENFGKLIDNLQLDDITLIVNDWGGPIGLSYAIAHPERVKNIVILNTWLWSTNDDWYYQVFSRFTGGPIGRFLIKNFNFFARTIVKSAYADKLRLTDDIHRHYLKPLENPRERKGNWVFPRQIIASGEWLGEQWSKIDTIQDKPALILWGMKDIAFREKELKRWTGTLTNCELHRFDDAGHYPHEEKSGHVCRILEDFLGKQPPASQA